MRLQTAMNLLTTNYANKFVYEKTHTLLDSEVQNIAIAQLVVDIDETLCA